MLPGRCNRRGSQHALWPLSIGLVRCHSSTRSRSSLVLSTCYITSSWGHHRTCHPKAPWSSSAGLQRDPLLAPASRPRLPPRHWSTQHLIYLCHLSCLPELRSINAGQEAYALGHGALAAESPRQGAGTQRKSTDTNVSRYDANIQLRCLGAWAEEAIK